MRLVKNFRIYIIKKSIKRLVFSKSWGYNGICDYLRFTKTNDGGDFTVTDKTMTFKIGGNDEDVMKDNLTKVYDALQEKGYNPVNQIVGYILSEDPTYITTHNNARSIIRRIDRDELLAEMVKSYLD